MGHRLIVVYGFTTFLGVGSCEGIGRVSGTIDKNETKIPVRVPVYIRIQHELRKGISSGAYGPGGRLPSETELSKRFATTRATVARALHELVFDGTIIRKAGIGSFVTPSATGIPLESRRLKSFEEQVLEAGETVDYQLANFSLISATENIATRLNISKGEKIYRLERLRSIKGIPLSLETRFIPCKIAERITNADLAKVSIHEILEQRLGIPLSRIEVVVRVATASKHVAQLLEVQTGRPLLVRDNVLVGTDGLPIIAGTSLYTEQFKLDYVVQRP
jgi:GntR family transcriptional regulator